METTILEKTQKNPESKMKETVELVQFTQFMELLYALSGSHFRLETVYFIEH